MEPYQIILLILVFAAFFYLAVVVYVVGHMFEFKQKTKKRLKALNVILLERADILADMQALYEKGGVIFTDAEAKAGQKLLGLQFVAREEEVRHSITTVKDATTCFRFIAQSGRYKGLSAERLKSDLDVLDDLERNFRTSSLLYNADVTGYNYWITVPTVAWIGWLLGHRKKELIS